MTPDQADSDYVISLNKALRSIKSIPTQGLMLTKLDMGSVTIRVYTESGQNTNPDRTYQLGVTVLVADKGFRCNLLHWSSKNCARYTNSMISEETYAFIYGYSVGVCFKYYWKQALSWY